MRILITGAAGFIGSNLARMAIENGHHVLCYDLLTYAGNLMSLEEIRDHPRFRFAKGDVAEAAAVRSAFADFQPDAVMHLAAESHVDRSIDSPGQFIQTNINGTFTMLQAARSFWEKLTKPKRDAFRFVHVSTDEVYGALGEKGYFREDSPYDPHSPYSASKAGSDHLARAWQHTYGLPVIVTNCSNNYGPFQFPEKLVPLVILKALRCEAIPVYGVGENIRDWLYVRDHGEALLTILCRGSVGHTYNIGGANEMRNIDLVQTLCRLLDETHPRPDGVPYASQITFVPDRPGHDFRYAIDSSKLRTELGWAPRQDRETGFRQTVEWYLDNQTWWTQVLSGEYRLARLGLGSGTETNSHNY